MKNLMSFVVVFVMAIGSLAAQNITFVGGRGVSSGSDCIGTDMCKGFLENSAALKSSTNSNTEVRLVGKFVFKGDVLFFKASDVSVYGKKDKLSNIKHFPVTVDTELPSNVASSLGVKSVIVLKNRYPAVKTGLYKVDATIVR